LVFVLYFIPTEYMSVIYDIMYVYVIHDIHYAI